MTKSKNDIIKKLLLIYAFIFAYSIGISSEIKGIGPFKINETTPEQFIKIMQENKIKEVASNKSLNTFQYNFKEIKGNVAYATSCPKAKVYNVSKIVISEIEVKNLIFTFYENKLIKIDFDFTDEIENVFLLKYGQPETKYKTDTTECSHYYTGNLEKHEKYSKTDNWENVDIILSLSLISSYDSNCRLKSYHFGMLYDKITTGNLYECEKQTDTVPKPTTKNISDF